MSAPWAGRRTLWSRLFGRRSTPTPAVASTPRPAPAADVAPTPPQQAASAGAALRPVEISPEIIAVVPGFSRAPESTAVAEVPSTAPAPPATAPPAPAPEPAAATEPPALVPEVDVTPPSAAAEPLTENPALVDAPEPADEVDRTRLASAEHTRPAALVLPGGERIEVSGAGVLGRNPAAIVGHEVVHVVPVSDPTRSVSKTHLGFGVDAVGLWVKDLHSTNGTAVRSPEGVRTPLQPGLAVHVAPGDVVVVGDVELGVER